jgi:hypothetical protein
MPRLKKQSIIKRPRKKVASLQTVKGMRDILPKEQFLWDHVLKNSILDLGKLTFQFWNIPNYMKGE